MSARKLLTRGFARAILTLLTAAPAQAAAMDLEWDPVSSPDLSGYRLYYGTQPGVFGSSSDVGNLTTSTLQNLAPCSYYYVAVKGRNVSGSVSATYSNVVEGYPRPEIVSVSPSTLRRGERATLVVAGAGFVSGAIAGFTSGGILVNSVRVDACARVTLDVTVPEAAALGWAPLEITNTDGAFGRLTQALQVSIADPGVDGTLNIVSVSPASGAAGVDPRAPVRIVFSRPLDPRTVTSARFKVQRAGANGPSLAQSPVLDATGTTVTLGIDGSLQAGQAYAVSVRGGKNGVKDVNGVTMQVDYEQSPPYTTADLIASASYLVPDPAAVSAPSPLQPGSQVPATATFIVRFAQAVEPGSINARTMKIRKLVKGKIALMDGGPILLPDGVSVLLNPREPLSASTSYELVIKGGGKGVASPDGVRCAGKSIPFTVTIASVGALGVAE